MTDIRIRIDPLTDALINVDIQTAFMPGGGLPVTDGDGILPVVLAVGRLFPKARRYATVDCHSAGHISLVSSYVGLAPYVQLTQTEVATWNTANQRLAPTAKFQLTELQDYLAVVGTQTLWPDHALKGSTESLTHPSFGRRYYGIVLFKGCDPACDSYSGVRDNLKRPTGLADILRRAGVRRVFLTGLAFDFCVGWTALDLAAEGFEVIIVEDATRSVGLPGTVEKMSADLAAAGVRLVPSASLLAAS